MAALLYLMHTITNADQRLRAVWETERRLPHRHQGKAGGRSEEDLGHSIQSGTVASERDLREVAAVQCSNKVT